MPRSSSPSDYETAERDLFESIDAERRLGPPRLAIGEAIRRHLFLVAIPIVLCVAAAVAVGTSREPVYTAETRVGIARVDVNTPGALAGYAVAAKQLAEAYSRTIGASEILEQVSEKSGFTREAVRNRLNAVPIPDTPVLRVVARGPSARQALGLSNLGADELITYVGALNRSTPESSRIYARYKRVLRQLSAVTTRRDLAKRDYDESDTSRNLDRVTDARADLAAVQARADALLSAYQTSTLSIAATPLLQLLSPATEASSDRNSKLQLMIFFGFLAGLAAGVALAVARAARLSRRMPT